MRTSPYRTPAQRPEGRPPATRLFDDGDVVPVYVVVWAGSLIRLVQAFSRGEAFCTELALAGLAVVVLPALAEKVVAAALLRRRPQGNADGDS